MHKRFKVFLAGFYACLFILFSNSTAYPLVEKALSTKLYSHPRWLHLLHYRDGKSEIDSKSFFFSKNGKIDPKAELIATIKAFLSSKEKGDKHSICKFPARFLFLEKNLGIKKFIKPYPECKNLKKFLKELETNGLSFIFADAYINNPASMYGHTFLRIDAKYKSKLMAHAVNFAAKADPSEGVKYYFKGIFGLYKGIYSVFPYYKKIHEYTNMEHRDLWEYKLKITTPESLWTALHVWELKNQYSYYYFFNKNCSYHILSLIEVAKPSLNLRKNFKYWTIPVDTIRLLKEKNLIESVDYRPSPVKKIRYLLKTIPDLSDKDVSLVKKVARFKEKPEKIINLNIPQEKKAILLDLAKELFFYYATKEKISLKEYRKKLLILLRARSKVKVRTKYEVPKPVSPENGHRTQMISLKTGLEGKSLFYGIRYSTAYHSLNDNDTGYLYGSEVLFPAVEFRIFPKRKNVVIEEINLIRIKSFSIRDKIFKPVSWGGGFFFKRDWIDQKRKAMFFNFYTMYGFANGIENRYIYFFGVETDVKISLKTQEKSIVALGFNNTAIFSKGNLKIVLNLTPEIQLTKNRISIGYKSNFISNLSISQNFAFMLKVSSKGIYRKTFTDIELSFKRYF